jgi:hypothetical protein
MQSGFDGGFGEHLSTGVEIFLGFKPFGRFAGKGLYCFLIDGAYP